MTTLILINSWRWFPFVAVMLLAGLQRIPGELYEAAAIDGASHFARFRRITLPLLQPTLFVLTGDRDAPLLQRLRYRLAIDRRRAGGRHHNAAHPHLSNRLQGL